LTVSPQRSRSLCLSVSSPPFPFSRRRGEYSPPSLCFLRPSILRTEISSRCRTGSGLSFHHFLPHAGLQEVFFHEPLLSPPFGLASLETPREGPHEINDRPSQHVFAVRCFFSRSFKIRFMDPTNTFLFTPPHLQPRSLEEIVFRSFITWLLPLRLRVFFSPFLP